MEVIPGVHRMKIPLPEGPLEYINVYLVEGNKGCLLVDTGWDTPEAFSILEEQLGEDGFKFGDISQVVITHIHPDHYGLAGKLKEFSGATLAMHQLEINFISSRYIDIEELMQRMMLWLRHNGTPETEAPKLQRASLLVRRLVVPAVPEKGLHGGERISTGLFDFEVIWTPGHSPGHVCLYEPNKKILFSGDHVLPGITPNISYHPQSGDNPLGDFLNSLKALQKLDVDLVLPGHESPFEGLKQRIEELLHHHEDRLATIMAVIGKEPKTAYQVTQQIPWIIDDKTVHYDELSPLDKRLAVLETLAHLRLADIEGKASSTALYSVTTG